MAHLFEQQPRETAKAFAAFSLYLNMGPERSLEEVGVKCGKSSRLIQRWSSRWKWAERLEAHAAYLATVEREAVEIVARGKAAEWVKRKEALLEDEWAVHEECIRAGREALKRFYERGKGATLGDIARIFAEASRLGRLASGMPTDRTEVSGEIEATLDVEWELAIKKVYGQAAPARTTTEPAPAIDVEVVPATPALPERVE